MPLKSAPYAARDELAGRIQIKSNQRIFVLAARRRRVKKGI
jgi:hypothetical protein